MDICPKLASIKYIADKYIYLPLITLLNFVLAFSKGFVKKSFQLYTTPKKVHHYKILLYSYLPLHCIYFGNRNILTRKRNNIHENITIVFSRQSRTLNMTWCILNTLHSRHFCLGWLELRKICQNKDFSDSYFPAWRQNRKFCPYTGKCRSEQTRF